MGRKKVAQRYALWTERIHEHYASGEPFVVREALIALSEKYNTTYYPTARQMAMVLRSDKRFTSKKNLSNNRMLWYVRS